MSVRPEAREVPGRSVVRPPDPLDYLAVAGVGVVEHELRGTRVHRRETGIREVALPAGALGDLAHALEAQAGSLAAIHALHQAGYASGEHLFDAFKRGGKESSTDTVDREFWSALVRFLERRGWGTLTHTPAHPGVGLLVSTDWAEAEGREESQPSCSFSVGMLSRVLSGAAGAPVAALEVSCRSRGDATCKFAFGSPATMHELYGQLLEGGGIDGALARL
jgi:predicted hydrocarbon binding protein